MPTKVKICGIKTQDALDAALAGGADFVGFVFYPPSPRNLTPAAARNLMERVRGRAQTVASLVDPDDALLDRIAAEISPDLIQLHGSESPERVADVAMRSGRPAFKALSISTSADAEAGLAYRGVSAEFVLFDAKAPSSLAGALPGGNGLLFDWRLLDGVRGKLDFVLSGGLTAENVGDAIGMIQPFAVDVSSGVERAPGEKSVELIRKFLAAAKSAPAII